MYPGVARRASRLDPIVALRGDDGCFANGTGWSARVRISGLAVRDSNRPLLALYVDQLLRKANAKP
jgi:hypothetical protein